MNVFANAPPLNCRNRILVYLVSGVGEEMLNYSHRRQALMIHYTQAEAVSFFSNFEIVSYGCNFV